MFDAEPFVARSAPTGLHFVGDKQTAVFARDLRDSLKISIRRNDKTADTENRFGHKRGDLARRRRLITSSTSSAQATPQFSGESS